VLGWFAALAGLLFLVRDQLGPVLTLVAGLLVLAAGIGFVLAPLMRRHAGTARGPDTHLLRSRSFLLGLVVTILGLAISGYGVYRIVQHAIGKANSTASAAVSRQLLAGAARSRP
jgi:hypothetical protein